MKGDAGEGKEEKTGFGLCSIRLLKGEGRTHGKRVEEGEYEGGKERREGEEREGEK